jgi:hypothetical protein
MRKIKDYQNNFTKGELDPNLRASPELAAYREGLAAAENVWVTATGGISKRYGMEDVDAFPGESAVALFPFINSRGTGYLIAALPGKIAVYAADFATHVATVDFPDLTAEALTYLCAASAGDSLIFTEERLAPHQLKWISGDDFALTPIAFTEIPSWEFVPNDVEPATTLQLGARTGYTTASMGADVFLEGDVGKFIQILPLGRLKISKVNGPRSVSGFLVEEAADTNPVPAGSWTLERGFSPLWGDGKWPAVCGFHGGRLLLGNFPGARTVFAYSMVDVPFSFSTGDGSSAYGGARKLSEDQADAIHHFFSSTGLYIFCAASEFAVDESSGAPIGTAQIRRDSARGSVRSIAPVESENGGATFFLRNNLGIGEFRYYFERASHESRTFTAHCGHLFAGPRRATLWKGDEKFSANILFFVNSNGELMSGTLRLAEKIAAFTRTLADKIFRDICAVRGSLYAAVEDTEGLTIRRFTPDAYADAGIPYRSLIITLPICGEGAPYFTSRVNAVRTEVYVRDTAHLEVDGAVVHAGLPRDGRLGTFSPGGWGSDGAVQLSDGAGTVPWNVNAIGRVVLEGGVE